MIGVAGHQIRRAVEVIIGVDTHKDQHVAVAIDGLGVWLGEKHVRVTTCGYKELERWSRSLGRDPRVRNRGHGFLRCWSRTLPGRSGLYGDRG